MCSVVILGKSDPSPSPNNNKNPKVMLWGFVHFKL
ncbi:Uncharacterised protein [Moraxella cuniculi]|uniref:Uncharacterized protein n=1 Tax=Moraxella cuniculi TaxID=34061 RepID=A0A448GZ78_9GAMM|nr:Uncharacterised protein [Moraxella cuniculi]